MIKIMVMSARTSDELVQQGVLDSRATLLQKPFTSAELREKVRSSPRSSLASDVALKKT